MRVSPWLKATLVVALLCLPAGMSLAEEENRFASLRRFSQVLDLVESHYVQDVNRKDLIDNALQGMIQQLDPHSNFMSKDEFKAWLASRKPAPAPATEPAPAAAPATDAPQPEAAPAAEPAPAAAGA